MVILFTLLDEYNRTQVSANSYSTSQVRNLGLRNKNLPNFITTICHSWTFQVSKACGVLHVEHGCYQSQG